MRAKPFLVIQNGDRMGERLAIEAGQKLYFGRDSNTDFYLNDRKISRKHASLEWNALDQTLILEDLGSLNGTYINGQLVENSVKLKHGDRIQLGAYTLELLFADSDHAVFDAPTRIETDAAKIDKTGVYHSVDEESLSLTGGRLISGKLSEISLADLLQLLAATKKSGRLVLSDKKILSVEQIEGRAKASLYIQNGELIYAQMGDLENELACYELVAMKEGYFGLFPHSDFKFKKKIKMPIEALLLESFRRLDESNQKPNFEASTRFSANIERQLTELKPDQLSVFQLAWKHQEYAEILAHYDYQPAKLDAILDYLVKNKFLKKEKS